MSTTRTGPTHAARERASDLVRVSVVLLMAVSQIAASVYVTRSGQDGFTKPFPGGDPPLIPATYAFAVWGPIYLGSLVFAIYHAVPSQRGRPLLRAIGWWVAAGFAATASWILVATDPRRIWLTVLILALLAAVLIVALRTIVRARDGQQHSRAHRFAMVAPLGVFAGWATVATAANIAAALRETDVTSPGSGEVALSLLLLLIATLVAALVLRALRGNAWYAMTVLWAVVAIAVANLSGETRPPNVTVASAAVLSALGVTIAFLRVRRRDPDAAERA